MVVMCVPVPDAVMYPARGPVEKDCREGLVFKAPSKVVAEEAVFARLLSQKLISAISGTPRPVSYCPPLINATLSYGAPDRILIFATFVSFGLENVFVPTMYPAFTIVLGALKVYC